MSIFIAKNPVTIVGIVKRSDHTVKNCMVLFKRIHNKDLQELSQVEKSLVYLSSSIRTNLMMLESLKNKKNDLHQLLAKLEHRKPTNHC